MAISARRPRWCAPTTRRPSPSRSRAKAACPPTRSWRSSRIPFANLEAARSRPAEDRERADHARAERAKRLADRGLHLLFMAFFAVGPGVCVWLALSELMPTRIRSNGMSIALLINQASRRPSPPSSCRPSASTATRRCSSPSPACTVIYFITAAFFLPETKGKTLEEIEEHFEGTS